MCAKEESFEVNVGKSKVVMCSKYGNGDRMIVRPNGEPLEEVDCLCTRGRKWQLMEYVKGMWYTKVFENT